MWNRFYNCLSFRSFPYHRRFVLTFGHRQFMKGPIFRNVVSPSNYRRSIFSPSGTARLHFCVRNKHSASLSPAEEDDNCDPLSDKRIIYSSELRSRRLEQKRLEQFKQRDADYLQSVPKSIFLRCVSPTVEKPRETDESEPYSAPVVFPYQESEAYPVISDVVTTDEHPSPQDNNHEQQQSPERILELIRKLRRRALREDYCGTPEEAALESEELWVLNYGNEDESTELSGAICSGCGAILHCRRAGWPGFVPAELLKALTPDQLRENQLTCQRCYFLRHHNTPLHVSVAAVDYEVMMARAGSERCLVLLLVDLLDFPGSVWPQLAELIGTKNPVIIAGNKVDLLPEDGPRFLAGIEECLMTQLRRDGFDRLNLHGVHLLSARSGFGVEDLVTDLLHNWKDTDIFLVGATNAGKSSMFNSLLQSDMCRTAEYNLIQRATVSQWPGTTLNLLKFPLLRPMSYHLTRRYKRLLSLRSKNLREEQLRRHKLRATREKKLAMLSGHIGRTFTGSTFNNQDETRINLREKKQTLTCLNDDHPNTHWLMDTPGCVTNRQLLDLLTQDELLLTLSRDLLLPRTFTLYPGQTLFVAGLARIDLVTGARAVRFTIFTSKHLPITVVATDHASDIYRQYLHSELFVVPRGGADRLAQWPGLCPVEQEVAIPAGWRENSQISCCDIVLSTAGWAAITPLLPCEDVVKFVSHSPRPEGVCVRTPPLLPRAVRLRGPRIDRTPSHGPHRLYVPSPLDLPEG